MPPFGHRRRADGTRLGRSIYNSHAVVALPAGRGGAIRARDLRRWLSQADLEFSREPAELLTRVTDALGHAPAESGHGALRLWGQTGDRPTVWMAAADPVYLEPRLDHLCLNRLSPDEVSSADLGQLIDELQSELGAEEGLGFVRLGGCGYLRGDRPMPTASLSAKALNGFEPSPFMPTGTDAAPFHRLLSEIQMALHLSEVHRRREQAGLRPVNALWIWGGGAAPEAVPRPIPPLFADEPLLQGYWRSALGVVDEWPGRLTECAARSPDGFVALVPHALTPRLDGVDALSAHLAELRELLRKGALDRLTLLFQDGITARVRRRHGLRVWRRVRAPLEPEVAP